MIAWVRYRSPLLWVTRQTQSSSNCAETTLWHTRFPSPFGISMRCHGAKLAKCCAGCSLGVVERANPTRGWTLPFRRRRSGAPGRPVASVLPLLGAIRTGRLAAQTHRRERRVRQQNARDALGQCQVLRFQLDQFPVAAPCLLAVGP